MKVNLGAVSGFFADIRNFLSFGRILGIDVGTVSIKLVELSRKGDRVTLENYGILETKEYLKRANAALQTSSLKLGEREAVPLLSLLLREVAPKARRAVVSIPSFAAFFVPIGMPLLSPEETSKSVAFEVRQHLPLPVEEVTIEWQKIEEFENQRGQRMQRLLITAVPKELVVRYTAIVRAAGIRLAALEVEPVALARALLPPASPRTMVIDIGGESTGIAIVEGGVVQHVGQSDYGGAALTQALARTLGVTAERAEALKRHRGLLGKGGEQELSTSLLPFLDVIIQECDRVRSLAARTSGKDVAQVMLVGSGANLQGVEAYVAGELKMRAVSPHPFARMSYPSELEPAVLGLSNELAVALGLALKYYV